MTLQGLRIKTAIQSKGCGNRGKGASLRTGFGAVTGDITVVQDADLEYDPREIARLIGSTSASVLSEGEYPAVVAAIDLFDRLQAQSVEADRKMMESLGVKK